MVKKRGWSVRGKWPRKFQGMIWFKWIKVGGKKMLFSDYRRTMKLRDIERDAWK